MLMLVLGWHQVAGCLYEMLLLCQLGSISVISVCHDVLSVFTVPMTYLSDAGE